MCLQEGQSTHSLQGDAFVSAMPIGLYRPLADPGGGGVGGLYRHIDI